MEGVESAEQLDVLVIGAGLSGIAAGHHLRATSPWASWAIFEARSAIGGTWDLFRYPGIRSDSDMYTLGYPFRPWTGTKSIADGADILEYIRETAREDGTDRHIRFHHRVVAADWSSSEGRWHVTAERSRGDDSGPVETVKVSCRFLLSCSGYYRYDQGYTPDFPGIDQFSGTVVHPQEWPENLEWTGKKVVVVGSGATAVTLIPSLADSAAHVTMLQRSPTYIIGLPDRSSWAPLFERWLPKERAGNATRWAHALTSQFFYRICKRWPERARRMLLDGVRQQLPSGYDVEKHFTPRYDPWDQRLCVAPNGDFFRAIREGRASVATDHIETFTAGGIRLKSGEELEADIIVTATGLERLFLGGIDVSLDGVPAELPSRLVYKGMMLEGVPNFAMAFGYTNASWTLKCDLTCDHVARLLNVLHEREGMFCMPLDGTGAVQPDPDPPLSAGYFVRTEAMFPKAGDRFPWRNRNSYLEDYRALKRKPVLDDALVWRSRAEARVAGDRSNSETNDIAEHATITDGGDATTQPEVRTA